jgi:Creatinase/Prolidase N-terminal domain
MRRGLISRSVVELPDAALEARLERVRAAMRAGGLDALLIYTNNTRPAGVSWLTGFVPYWSEALLVVPRDGAPYLVAALSFRVKSWIERVSRIGDILHHPRIGLRAGAQIVAARKNAAVGIVDFDGLPAGIAADLREAGPDLRRTDSSALFATLRGAADPAEIALASRAAGIAQAALAQAAGRSLNAMIAAVERQARLLGAEEIYIAAAPDLARDARFVRIEGERTLGKHFALRATVAYKGAWVRLIRAFSETAALDSAAAQLAEAVALLPSDRGFATFKSFVVEGCRTTQPLEPLMGSRLESADMLETGALVSVQAVVSVDGASVPVGAPALIGTNGVAGSLLADPLFD